MAASSRTTVIYVLSSPHSGSTLLGTLLGSHPSVHFAGELFEIPKPAWDPDHVCTCGQTASSCPFWTKVRTELGPSADAQLLGQLQAHFQRGLPLLSLILSRGRRGSRSWAFGERSRELAEAVSRASGRAFVVDSSHGPARALAYDRARSDSFEVFFLHVVRDGRRVVASRKRSDLRHSSTGRIGRHAALQYAFLWAGANLLFMARFGIGRRRYLRLRYEDLIADPAASLGRIGRFAGLDLSACVQQVLDGRTFSLGHVLSGNRFRLSGEVRMARSIPDDENGLLPRERRTFALVAGLAARLFGYS